MTTEIPLTAPPMALSGASLPGAVSLANLAPGALAVVADVLVDVADAVRLKSLGICVGRRVQLIKGGDPLMVRVLGARVGLSARLACGVFVQPL